MKCPRGQPRTDLSETSKPLRPLHPPPPPRNPNPRQRRNEKQKHQPAAPQPPHTRPQRPIPRGARLREPAAPRLLLRVHDVELHPAGAGPPIAQCTVFAIAPREPTARAAPPAALRPVDRVHVPHAGVARRVAAVPRREHTSPRRHPASSRTRRLSATSSRPITTTAIATTPSQPSTTARRPAVPRVGAKSGRIATTIDPPQMPRTTNGKRNRNSSGAKNSTTKNRGPSQDSRTCAIRLPAPRRAVFHRQVLAEERRATTTSTAPISLPTTPRTHIQPHGVK